jgi:hypothetical protein
MMNDGCNCECGGWKEKWRGRGDDVSRQKVYEVAVYDRLAELEGGGWLELPAYKLLHTNYVEALCRISSLTSC